MNEGRSRIKKTAVINVLQIVLAVILVKGTGSAGELTTGAGQPDKSNTSAPRQTQPPSQRPMTPDDINRMEQFGEQNSPLEFSPDGKSLAFVFVRPVTTSNTWPQNYLLGGDRSDVWIASVEGGKPTNITNGALDGSGYFMPSWSPDGERLAMLSTKGGSLRLWLWEKASGQLRMLTERTISFQPLDTPFIWASNDKLICSIMPEGQMAPFMGMDQQSQRTATRAWEKAGKGREPTASVVESGLPINLENRPQDQLTLFDLATGKNRVLATGTIRSLKLSPDRKQIAFFKRTSVFQPDPDLTLTIRSLRRFAFMGYRLMVTDIEGVQIPSIAEEIDNVYSAEWSKDSQELAVICECRHPANYKPDVVIYTPATHTTRTVMEDTFDPPTLMWSAQKQLLILNAQKSEENNSRLDWWMISADGSARNLSAGMKSVPAQLFELAGGGIVGSAAGNLWLLSGNGPAAKKLSVGLDEKINSIVWPNNSAREQAPVTKLVVDVKRGTATDYYLVDLKANANYVLTKPNEKATLSRFDPQTNTAVMIANTRNGSFLWLSRHGSSNPAPVMEANRFLSDIAEGERRQIEYRSLNGEPLKGWLILPLNYRKGQRYPLITWARAGVIFGDAPPLQTELNITIPYTQYNLQLLSAHGYAVLLPSMPIRQGNLRDAYLDLTDGVLPAVDKVIEMGIADTKRLGVMGHSYGGYTTYGLVTQTNKFQAAAAMSATANLISTYGLFEARLRYSDFPQENLPIYMYIAESARVGFGMGAPPWKDLGRYIRNSPLFYIERVETPIMIIHGDMDSSAPIEEGEQFFSALYRQNKRARFVRYWGEGHTIQSPANIVDMWQQIYRWFDELLVKTTDKP